MKPPGPPQKLVTKAHAAIRAGCRFGTGPAHTPPNRHAGPALARLAGALAGVALLAGCATARLEGEAARPATDAAADRVEDRLTIAGGSFAVEWWLPAAGPLALVTLQHGFARDCSFVRGTARQLAQAGLATLCVNAALAGGNPGLARSLASTLAALETLPDGRPLPRPVVAAGHSAGAVFAVHLGAALDTVAPRRVAGALLFDPVATPAFATDLLALGGDGRRPVLALMAAAGPCNARLNALPALQQLQARRRAGGHDAFVGLQFGAGSTHMDAEGDDTNALAVAACGPGRPQPVFVAALRTLAARWALAMAGDRPPAADAGASDLAASLQARGLALPLGGDPTLPLNAP